MKKTRNALLVLAAALMFGLGALSESVLAQLRVELQTRSLREQVNRDLLTGVSPSGVQFFQGRADGFYIASILDLSAPHSAVYLHGFADAFDQAALLLSEATPQPSDR